MAESYSPVAQLHQYPTKEFWGSPDLAISTKLFGGENWLEILGRYSPIKSFLPARNNYKNMYCFATRRRRRRYRPGGTEMTRDVPDILAAREAVATVMAMREALIYEFEIRESAKRSERTDRLNHRVAELLPSIRSSVYENLKAAEPQFAAEFRIRQAFENSYLRLGFIKPRGYSKTLAFLRVYLKNYLENAGYIDECTNELMDLLEKKTKISMEYREVREILDLITWAGGTLPPQLAEALEKIASRGWALATARSSIPARNPK
ncbi:hypothetical protein QA633_02870 [Bradyrhizobium barranii]|uniref:hypothetical protein n=1 Tax=Bradyrhizobium barranii TaxID=2992140 RepID=UPI0024B175E6|nr:hypothetical protein [Bradyrhizobium barranii]WFT96078.1 hypothetical protein QA633_02870 [Bradyrhizobium barranii]